MYGRYTRHGWRNSGCDARWRGTAGRKDQIRVWRVQIGSVCVSYLSLWFGRSRQSGTTVGG